MQRHLIKAFRSAFDCYYPRPSTLETCTRAQPVRYRKLDEGGGGGVLCVGSRESPHMNPDPPRFPSNPQEKSDQVAYVKVC